MTIPTGYKLDTELPDFTAYQNGKLSLYVYPNGTAKLTARVDQVDLTIGPFAWPAPGFQVFEGKLLIAREAVKGMLG